MARERKPKNFIPKPEYKGGPKAMSDFIASQMRYPKEALESGIEGTVVLRIRIDYKGRVLGSELRSKLGYGCDEEARRLVRLLKFEVKQKVRGGKVLYHKKINIHFHLPQNTQTTGATKPQSELHGHS